MLTPHVVACQAHQTFRGAGRVASLTLTLIMKLVLSMVVRFKHIVLLPSRKARLSAPLQQSSGGTPDAGHKATVPFTSLTVPCANRTLNSGCRKKSHFTRNSHLFFSPELPGSVRAQHEKGRGGQGLGCAMASSCGRVTRAQYCLCRPLCYSAGPFLTVPAMLEF